MDWIAKNMGIIQYAATNDLIVLYPFSTSEWHTGQRITDHPSWDANRHTKQGVQLDAIWKMVQRVVTQKADPIDQFNVTEKKDETKKNETKLAEAKKQEAKPTEVKPNEIKKEDVKK